MTACVANRSLSDKSSLRQLDIEMNEGLLRVGGRLRKVNDVDALRHPIVVPKDSSVTALLVKESHERLGHLGVGTVLADLRERFWIVNGHATVKKILRRCVICRRVRGPVVHQNMADLPIERTQHNGAPFTNTGVDCFGPFTVKLGRRTEKRYGVIFTCLAMRAVHLEVACDLSTDGMLNSIRRFVARRGTVQKFMSDNGTNFVGSLREIMQALSCRTNRQHLLHQGLEWEFNPPGASHFGGAWERLIGVVRRVLEAMLGNQSLTDDSLRTLFCEVEIAVNSRPLSVVSSDHRDLEAITPNKLLTLGECAQSWTESETAATYSRRRWRQVQHLADQFWKRWSKEYRVTLQERRKWMKRQDNLKEGDVVLLVNDLEARCHWPLGRVVTAIPSDDGLVRKVDVSSNHKIYRRPVAKLVLLLSDQDLL